MVEHSDATHYSQLAIRLANGLDQLLFNAAAELQAATLPADVVNAKLTKAGIMAQLTSSGLMNKITLLDLMTKITSSAFQAEMTNAMLLAVLTNSGILSELTNSGVMSKITTSGLQSKLAAAILAAQLVASATDNIRKKGDLAVSINANGLATLNTPGVVPEFMNVTVFNENVVYQGMTNTATSAATLRFKVISADAAHEGCLTASALLANSGLTVSGGYDYQVV